MWKRRVRVVPVVMTLTSPVRIQRVEQSHDLVQMKPAVPLAQTPKNRISHEHGARVKPRSEMLSFHSTPKKWPQRALTPRDSSSITQLSWQCSSL